MMTGNRPVFSFLLLFSKTVQRNISYNFADAERCIHILNPGSIWSYFEEFVVIKYLEKCQRMIQLLLTGDS